MKIYSSCPKKLDARFETIINKYRQYYQHSLPEDKQYWTMCATHADEEYNLLDGCELDQMLKAELITPNQFHGVDINEEIIENNRIMAPDVNWHNDDFYDAMVTADNEDNFNPGIVFCDHLEMPKKGAPYATSIMALITDLDITDIMYVINLIIRTRHMTSSPEEMWDEIQKCPTFQHSWEKGWNFDNEAYVYNGTGGNYTWLCSMVFYK